MQASFQGIRLGGIAASVGEHRVGIESELSRLYDGDEKRLKRAKKSLGLNTRHLVENGTTALDLCFHAAKNLLTQMDFDSKNLSALIVVTQTPDCMQPGNAYILHSRLGLPSDCLAYDINAGCSGYVQGLNLAFMLIKAGFSAVLLCAGDTLSRVINPHDSNMAPLFGDAGSATLVLKDDLTMDSHFNLKVESQGFHCIMQPNKAISTLCYTTSDSGARSYFVGSSHYASGIDGKRSVLADRNEDYLQMDGGEVFNFSLRSGKASVEEVLALARTSLENVDYVFFHQANAYILSNIARKLGLDLAKAPSHSFSKYGNTSSASIPLAICESLGGLEAGDRICVLSGFGVGLSWGAALLCIDSKCALSMPDIYHPNAF